jgi:hypothetical protein
MRTGLLFNCWKRRSDRIAEKHATTRTKSAVSRLYTTSTRKASQEKKGAFLKKSAQKLLLIWATGVETNEAQRNQKFFASFFKKEALSLYLRGVKTAAHVFVKRHRRQQPVLLHR